MRYRGILFDLDGTLLDTLEDLADAVNYALEKYRFPPKTLEQVREYVGNGLLNLMTRCIPDAHPDFDTIFADFKEYYLKNCRHKTKPYPEILELLQKLTEENRCIAVISNKNDIAVKELNQVFFQKFIPVAIGESDAVRKKPAPDSVFAAMDELGLAPEECVYIGDSDVDIRTAHNAGIPCISVTWGFRDRAFLLEHGAEILADNCEELYHLL